MTITVWCNKDIHRNDCCNIAAHRQVQTAGYYIVLAFSSCSIHIVIQRKSRSIIMSK